jgi:hypothetical protein
MVIVDDELSRSSVFGRCSPRSRESHLSAKRPHAVARYRAVARSTTNESTTPRNPHPARAGHALGNGPTRWDRGPTHGVVFGHDFHFIANRYCDRFDNDGHLTTPDGTPARLVRAGTS